MKLQARSLSFALVALGLAACDDTTRVRTFPLTVQVEYPATYAESGAGGARVILRSLERGSADTATTDAAGVASFARVVPGSYEVSASRTLTEAEALQLTGGRATVQLNAVAGSEMLDENRGALRLRLSGAPVGSWVIKEAYYAGSRRTSGGTYFFDQFYELYNNSTDTLYAGGLLLVNAYGVSGQINATSQPTPFGGDAAHVYADEVWRIPGGPRDHAVAPGGSVVVAQQGLNHRSDPNANPGGSPVDLGTANWEMYVAASGRDIDSPGVPNLELVHKRSGFYALFPVFGPGLAIARASRFTQADSVAIPGAAAGTPPVLRIAVDSVLDAVETLQNANSGTYKRIPVALDAGFTHVGGTYTGEAVRRRTERVIGTRRVLRDTNNSSNDFEVVATPSPRGF